MRIPLEIARLAAWPCAIALALAGVQAAAQSYPDREPGIPPLLRGTQDESTVTGEEADVDEAEYEADVELTELPPPRVLPEEEEDPYAPLGIRLGAFRLYPSLEGRLGYSTNVYSSTVDPEAGTYYRLLPEIVVESDWSRHLLRARAAADHQSYFDLSGEDTTAVEADVEGRLDITSDTIAGLRLSYVLLPEDRGDPDVPRNVVEPPDTETLAADASLAQRFGRIEVSLRGGVERNTYDNAVLEDGTIVDNSDRNYDEIDGALRTSLDVADGTRTVFVELGANRRRYDRRFDDNGIERGSEGYDVLVGMTFDRGDPLSGEIGIGYQRQTPDDPNLPVIDGLTFRGLLVWRPTALTTVSFDGSILPEESTLEPTASGARVYTVNVDIEHALRRNLIASALFEYQQSDYVGSPRVERDVIVGAGLEYLANRWLSFRLDATHERFELNIPGEDYEDTRIEIGARVQR